MASSKFWIVEYVDVSAPKAERSEICASRSEAIHRAVKREAILHYETLETFVGRGFCDSLRMSGTFDNELGGYDARV